jgi:voltage-gated potassium channel
MTLQRRLLAISFAFAAVILLGGVGYALLEGWSWTDAFYMAIITITTVGFGEVHPLTPAGKLFTSVLILLGVATITYAFTALTNYLIAGKVGNTLEEFRMKRQIGSLENHYIVCGFGRVGQQVCAQLHQDGQPFVVVEADEVLTDSAKEEGYAVVLGDAGEDQILLQAGISRATGLVAAVSNDAENLFVVLSARSLKQDLLIVARADTEQAVSKLLRAGANRVISPYSLGGRLIAQTLIRPDVVDFLDVVLYDDSLKLFLEDLTVTRGCPLDQLTVGEARIRETTGANILGIKRGGQVIVSPPSSTQLEQGDVLVALGTRQELTELGALVQ